MTPFQTALDLLPTLELSSDFRKKYERYANQPSLSEDYVRDYMQKHDWFESPAQARQIFHHFLENQPDIGAWMYRALRVQLTMGNPAQKAEYRTCYRNFVAVLNLVVCMSPTQLRTSRLSNTWLTPNGQLKDVVRQLFLRVQSERVLGSININE